MLVGIKSSCACGISLVALVGISLVALVGISLVALILPLYYVADASVIRIARPSGSHCQHYDHNFKMMYPIPDSPHVSKSHTVINTIKARVALTSSWKV